jgi:hypothetical protein
MKQFSILITTRQRVEMLHNLLASIYRTTSNKNGVEIRVIYDNDDIITDNYVKHKFHIEFGNPPKIETFFHIRKRSPNLVNDYHNWCSRKFAQGKYIIFSNDDALFEMDRWDVLTETKLLEFEKIRPDGILYGMPQDFEYAPARNENNWMACFPLISKKVVEILGFAFDPSFQRDGADWAMAKTFQLIDRVVDLRDTVVIKHLSFRSGRRKKDDLDLYALSLGFSNPPIEISARKNAEILQSYINKYNQVERILKGL